MPRDRLAAEAKQLIDRLAATPRGTGTAGEAQARKHCAGYLARAGFEINEEQFSYSALPGRWAVPLFGLLSLTWFAVIAAALDRPMPHQTVLAALPFLLVLPVLFVVAKRMTLSAPALRRTATNLVALRGAPEVWLVAHLDSKSQPVPMLVRIAGILMAASVMAISVGAAFVPGALPERELLFWAPVTAVGILGSLAILFSTVGNRSPGALDNASGVAAALLAARHAPPTSRVAVLLTSAEELGVVGARAWATEQAHRYVQTPRSRRAINFDGLDDVGTLTCMADDGNVLTRQLRQTGARTGATIRFRRVLPGIMVDAQPLREAGWDAVTISKGNLSTLARIHSSKDAPSRLQGLGVAEAARLVTELLEGSRDGAGR